jgi:uncharacterized repeat protein (TIGR03803 family)
MAATLTTLIGFNLTDGSVPRGSLITDSNGDLFGTTESGGANNGGTVFEIVKSAGGYASAPTTLVTFNSDNGADPAGGLIVDASGDLFGTTQFGPSADGTVFEIVKTAGGYASTPTTLASFDEVDGERPQGNLAVDANGDLFGTTEFGGPSGEGVVFEIAKTPTGYASTPIRLVSFNGSDGASPQGNLVVDANGDLFGMTNAGGPGPTDIGTVFEIAKTPTGYAGTPTTLAGFFSFDVGGFPEGGLIADANGDLFGTTDDGGAIFGDGGVVFEVAKTAGGYASTPATLVNFTGADGEQPMAGLLMDANGDLFGTTYIGGSDNLGTVFEIKKSGAGYASTPTVLANFNGTNGDHPMAGLVADANGNLFGTTSEGGPNDSDIGTAFEITNSGFATTATVTPPATVTADILWQNKSSGQASFWEMDESVLVGGGPVTPNPGTSFHAVGTGDFNKDGHPDILWQNTSTGQASIWEMNGSSLIGGGPVTPNPGLNFHAVATGDFNGDGFSDILWQNTSTGQASIWEMQGNTLEGGGPVTPNPGPSFRVVGTGDFNKDGDSDIVWQNTATGQVSIWEMQGNKLIGGGPVTPNPGTAWQAIGTGDFNHDGFSDILLQNSNTGAITIWEMNGTGLIGGGPVANPGLTWHAIGTGAGGSDILLQNTSGQATIWEMDGNTIAGGGPVSPNPGPSFRAVGLT